MTRPFVIGDQVVVVSHYSWCNIPLTAAEIRLIGEDVA